MHSLNRTALHFDSYLGSRVATTTAALSAVDLDLRLAGFEQRPGEHPFLGEHVGKWIDAATALWLASGDDALKERLDTTVARLVAAQEEDGYLGTYEAPLRYTAAFGAAWDVWTSKYCIVGLVSYHLATGDGAAIGAARRLADHVMDRFRVGAPSILRTDTHGGLASGSILLAFTRLYSATGERAYLDFAGRLFGELNSEAGPRLRPTLLATGRVSQVGNGKAYEMLSCIHGMLELGLLTDDDDSVRAAVTAWEDVRENHLYISGTASFGEHFHLPGDLPASESANMGETCVTTTWIQLSAALYERTGESRYLDEAERSLFNQLAAAAHPTGAEWCYYMPLQGKRDYRVGVECCSSSGPRAVALGQSLVFAVGAKDELVVGLYQSARSEATLAGARVGLELRSGIPFDGDVTLLVEPERDARFALSLRKPHWASSMLVDGIEAEERDGWVRIPARTWSAGSEVSIRFGAEVRRVIGTGWNEGRIAFTQGPLVLAHSPVASRPSVGGTENPPLLESTAGAEYTVRHPDTAEPMDVIVRPFAEAGYDGNEYRVWLSAELDTTEQSLFRSGTESRSGRPYLVGSAIDGDRDTSIHSFGEGGMSEQGLDWVAVDLEEPVMFQRVVVAAGIDANTGGWFDTVSVMPEIQVRDVPEGPWRTVAVLENYPPTSTVDDGGVRPGQRFEVSLAQPVTASGLRIRGVGSWGHVQFARRISISELAAFAE